MSKKSENYPFIRWWGKICGSMQYYIDLQIERASADGAPQTATYERYDNNERSGNWSTIHDITSETTLDRLKRDFGDDVLEVHNEAV